MTEKQTRIWKINVQHIYVETTFREFTRKASESEPITKIICNRLDIKLGQFTQEELDLVLGKIKNRKAEGLDEIPPEVWKTRELTTYCSNSVITKA